MASELHIEPILDELVDETWKGIPGGVRGLPIRDLPSTGWNLAAGDLPLPVLAMRRSAVEHNLGVMGRFCEEVGALLAPHGKTTMAPQLFARQLAAGAWAFTAASVQHLQVYRRFGICRVILANEVVGEAELKWLGDELALEPDLEVRVLVDAPVAIERLAIAGERAGRAIPALVEIGYQNGRTGVRDAAALDAVLRSIDAHGTAVSLSGVEAFEGLLAPARPGLTDPRLGETLDRVAATAERLRATGHLPPDHLVTVGGSLAFDVVAERLAPVTPPPARLVLRSGCYLTHDHGTYASGSPLVAGASAWAARVGTLAPALELWAQVLSVPEPGLALLGCGRRDSPFDAGLPVPLHHLPGPSGSNRVRVAGQWEVVRLDDQHAYLRCPAGAEPRVADRVVLGISHPCGAFDRWRLVFEVDDEDTVVGGVRTFF